MQVYCDTNEVDTGSVDSDPVEKLEYGDEVIETGGVSVFNTNVVNEEGERDRVCVIVPEGCGMFYGVVNVVGGGQGEWKGNHLQFDQLV